MSLWLCVSVTVCVYVCLFMCMCFGVHFSVSVCVCVHSIYSKHLSDWLTWSLDCWEECFYKHRNADLFPCWRRVSFFVISYSLDMCLVVGLLDDLVALFLILGRNTHPSFYTGYTNYLHSNSVQICPFPCIFTFFTVTFCLSEHSLCNEPNAWVLGFVTLYLPPIPSCVFKVGFWCCHLWNSN